MLTAKTDENYEKEVGNGAIKKNEEDRISVKYLSWFASYRLCTFLSNFFVPNVLSQFTLLVVGGP